MTDLLFPAEPTQRALARELYALVRDLPLISPHGHVDAGVLADDEPFPDPARLIIVPDHYLTRMLLSQGIPPTRLGVPGSGGAAVESDGRAIWRLFADNWHLFRGTPSRLWLERTFSTVFGVTTPLRPSTADLVYDEIAARLAEPEFRPRALFDRFNIEVLATTESPLDDLARHAKLAADGWGGPGGRVITTFRPDDVVDMDLRHLGRVRRPARRGRRRGHRDVRGLPRRPAVPAGRRSSPLARPRRTTDIPPRGRWRSTRPRRRGCTGSGWAAGRPRPTPRRSARTC